MVQREDHSSASPMSKLSPSMMGVKDDMVAIFGSDQRSDEQAMIRAQPAQSRTRRKVIIAALTVCGLASMLAAGVVGGKSVLHADARRAAEASGLYKVPKVPSSPRQSVGTDSGVQLMSNIAVPAEVEPGQSTARPVASVQPTTPASPPRSVADANPAGRVTQRGANQVTMRDEVPQAVALGPEARPPVEGDTERAQSVPASLDRPSCSTRADCFAPLLRSREQEVAAAYEQAAIAGVRPKTLREYRSEWSRARRLIATRPAEAARVYGMVAADLRLLAADPTTD